MDDLVVVVVHDCLALLVVFPQRVDQLDIGPSPVPRDDVIQARGGDRVALGRRVEVQEVPAIRLDGLSLSTCLCDWLDATQVTGTVDATRLLWIPA
jgi:hypothetical protein